jgi:hypothetical protein
MLPLAGVAAEPAQPAAPAPAPAAPSATPAPAPAPVDEVALAEQAKARSAMMRELRSAEEEVHALKERVFRSKATLQLLRELAVEGAHSAAELRVTHVEALPRAFEIDSIQYFLDGKTIWSWAAGEGSGEVPAELLVRDQPIAAGQHNLQVAMTVRGEGRGVFEYLDDYRLKVESSYPFQIEGGTVTDLTVKVVVKGGVQKKFTERPTVVYEERHEQLETP